LQSFKYETRLKFQNDISRATHIPHCSKAKVSCTEISSIVTFPSETPTRPHNPAYFQFILFFA